MFRRGLEIVSLMGLWSANLMIIASFFSGDWLGVLGILVGTAFGLPAAFLLLFSNQPLPVRLSRLWHELTKRQKRHKTLTLAPKSEVRAPSAKTVVYVPITDGNEMVIKEQRIIEQPKPVRVPLETEAPVRDGAEVAIREPRIIEKPKPVHVPIEIETTVPAETSGAIDPVAVKTVPTEWEQKMHQDALYEEAKTALAGLADDNYAELTPYLTHADARVRLAVVQKLRRVPDGEATALLNQALEDTDTVVQRAVRIALEERQKQ